MAINKNSNAYIIIYTIVMVVIVGAVLAFLATYLKPQQDANVLNEQKVSIMRAFGEATAESETAAVVEQFDSVSIMTITDGVATEVDKNDAEAVQAIFTLLGSRKDLAAATENLPIFVLEKDGTTKYVLPMVGKGLWGDIWGYISLQSTEGNYEITGIVMDHAGETPGLGAEIATSAVQDLFKGILLYDENSEFAVRMQKGGAQNAHQVDAITGGTKTCDGVNNMLASCIERYESFLMGQSAAAEADADVVAAAEEVVAEETATEAMEGAEPVAETNVELNTEEE